MSCRPGNLKLALDAYDAQQRRQAALFEAQRIGNLIHIQEQQLLAAKYLAKQRKSQRRRAHLSATGAASSTANGQPAKTAVATTTIDEDQGGCAIEDEEEEEEEDEQEEEVQPVPSGELAPNWKRGMSSCVDILCTTTVSTPISPSFAARRAARSASKRTSLLPVMAPVLEFEEDCTIADTVSGSTESHSMSEKNAPIQQRWAAHKRRPLEPYAILASRSQWKVRFQFLSSPCLHPCPCTLLVGMPQISHLLLSFPFGAPRCANLFRRSRRFVFLCWTRNAIQSNPHMDLSQPHRLIFCTVFIA